MCRQIICISFRGIIDFMQVIRVKLCSKISTVKKYIKSKSRQYSVHNNQTTILQFTKGVISLSTYLHNGVLKCKTLAA